MGLLEKINRRVKNSYRDGGIKQVVINGLAFPRKMPRIAARVSRRKIVRAQWLAKFHAKRTRAILGQTSILGHRGVFFSVVVPVYNHGDYLPLCIQSILNQNHRNFELILVDDASPQPEVKAILRRFEQADNRVRTFFNEKNQGIVDTTNTGIVQSRGQYIAFVDCDDMLKPNALREVAKAIARKPSADFLFTDRIRIDGKGREIGREIYGGRPDLAFADPSQNLLEEMVTSHLKVIKRSAFLKVGLFDRATAGVQDYDLALKLSEKGELLYVPKAVYLYRWHDNSVTLSRRTSQIQKSASVKRRALARRYVYGMPDYQFSGNSRTKVLFVVPWLVVGGAEKVLLELAEGLKASGQYELYFIATIKGGAWRKKFERLGQVSVLSGRGFDGQPAKVKHIAEFVRKQKIDIVHTSNAEEGFLAAPHLWQQYPRPYMVATLHSDFHSPEAGFVRWVHKYDAYFDKFVFVNELIQKKVGIYFPDELKPEVIYNGVNLGQFARPHQSKNIILYASRLSAEKQPAHIIRLAQELKKHRQDFEVWIAGDGDLEEDLKKMAKKRGLVKQVRFLGAVDNVADLYQQAGITVLTSTTEGTPMVFAEALAAGCPVAAYDVGGISEMIDPGNEGFLIKGGSYKTMAASIDKLFSDKKMQLRMSRAARARAKQQFNAKDMVSNYDKIYRGLMADDKSFQSRKLSGPLLSFVILFFNRLDDSKKCIETIKNTIKLPYEIIILDNNSNQETKSYLKTLESDPDIRVFYEPENLGCPGGRRKAIRLARGKYIATIDNDMLIDRHWAEDMIMRLEEDPDYMGVVSKVKMLTGLLEFVGGSARFDRVKKSVKFSLIGNAQPADDLKFMETLECDWIPGGSTVVKSQVLKIAEHCADYINAFEDNDYALQLKHLGYKLVNCPTASALHHHSSTLSQKELKKEKEYIKTRINNEKLLKSAAVFYKRWGLFIEDPVMYEMLGLSKMSRKEIAEQVFKPLTNKVKRYPGRV